MRQFKRVAVAIGLAISFLGGMHSGLAAPTKPEKPTCVANSQCIEYDGSSQSSSFLKDLTISTQNRSITFSNSLGFSTSSGTSVSTSGNSVVVTSGQGIEGVVRGASASSANVERNTVYIDLSGKSGDAAQLSIKDSDWNDSELDQVGGFISAGNTEDGSGQQNKVFLKGTYDPSTPSSESLGSICNGGITASSTIGARSSSRVQLLNNQIWLENVNIDSPTNHGLDATKLRSFITSAFLYTSPGTSKFNDLGADLNANSLTIIDSKIWTRTLGAGFADSVPYRDGDYSVMGYQANQNSIDIQGSTIDIVNDGSADNVGIYVGMPYYREGNQNTLSLLNSTLNVSNRISGRVYLCAAGYQASEANSNSIKIENSIISYTASDKADATAIDIRTAVAHNGATGNVTQILGASDMSGVVILRNVYALSDSGYSYSQNTLTFDGQSAQTRVQIQAANGDFYNVYQNVASATDLTADNNASTIRYSDWDGAHTIASVYFNAVKSVKQASGNTLTVDNSTFADGHSLYTVYTKVGGTYENNVLTIGDKVTSSSGGVVSFKNLAAVYIDNPSADSQFTLNNNRLEISSPIRAERLAGFNTYVFNLDGLKGAATPFIEVSDAIHPVVVLDDESTIPTGLTAATTSIQIVGSADTLESLSTPIVLISSMGGFVDATKASLDAGDYSHLLTQGATLTKVKSLARVESHAIDVSQLKLSIENMPATEANPLLRSRASTAGQNLVLELAGGSTDPQPPIPIPPPNQPNVDENGAVTESALSGLNTQFLSDDLLVDSVLLAPTRVNDGLFAAARTGRYHVHSQAKQIANTSNALLGYGRNLGASTVGVFVETGYSSYDTTVATALGNVVGDGSSSYAGAGVFGLYPLGSTGLFLQGYVKAGYLSHHYDVTLSNVPVNLDRTTPYWSAQLGLSWGYQLTDRVQAKTFLNYYYDGQGSETFDLAGTSSVAGAHFELDAMNAHRLVLGQMWTYQYQDDLKPYVGLRIEEALKAKATGQARDSQGYVPLGDTDLEGTTGIVSMGYSYTPTNANYGVHMGANGYVGVRNGVSAQIEAQWRF